MEFAGLILPYPTCTAHRHLNWMMLNAPSVMPLLIWDGKRPLLLLY